MPWQLGDFTCSVVTEDWLVGWFLEIALLINHVLNNAVFLWGVVVVVIVVVVVVVGVVLLELHLLFTIRRHPWCPSRAVVTAQAVVVGCDIARDGVSLRAGKDLRLALVPGDRRGGLWEAHAGRGREVGGHTIRRAKVCT